MNTFLATLPASDEQGLLLLLASKAPQAPAVESADQALSRLRIRSMETSIAAEKASLETPTISADEQREVFAKLKQLNKEILDAKKSVSPIV